eukprot:3104885-Alexandrium_andersonii.AAC.1
MPAAIAALSGGEEYYQAYGMHGRDDKAILELAKDGVIWKQLIKRVKRMAVPSFSDMPCFQP